MQNNVHLATIVHPVENLGFFSVSHPHGYPILTGVRGQKQKESHRTREDAVFYTLSCERDSHTHATREQSELKPQSLCVERLLGKVTIISKGFTGQAVV